MKDDAKEQLGHSLYEQFQTIVHLTQQVCVIDKEWQDVLHHIHNGSCHAHHLQLLCSLIVTDSQCPPFDFNSNSWNDAILITPHYAVHHHWNTEIALKYCHENARQMFICNTYDIICNWPPTLSEQFCIASKQSSHGSKLDEQGGLADEVLMAIGMKVMVTYNIETDPDIANGARGEIIEIVLDEHESSYSLSQSVIQLEYPPAYMLIKMLLTKASSLEGLDENVIHLIPMERTFSIIHGNQCKTVVHKQLPLTSAYAFTDYRSQGQTIQNAIIDITSLPTENLMPFNIYVALSHCRGREGLCLLCDFDDKLLTSHPSEYLRTEGERLVQLDREINIWWKAMQTLR